MYLRRKGLAREYGLSIRTIDYVLEYMYQNHRYDRYILRSNRAVMVNPQGFEQALKERREVKL